MSRSQKLTEMQFIVYDNYCSWELFMENVLSYESRADFLKKVDACEDDKDLRKLVNQYI